MKADEHEESYLSQMKGFVVCCIEVLSGANVTKGDVDG
jgi:hypothetical protein